MRSKASTRRLRHPSAGLDYAFTENWSFGAFGAYSMTDADLGSVDGYTGSRSSDGNIDSWWGAGYVKANYDAFYLTGVGIFGQGSTDLTNGVLLTGAVRTTTSSSGA